MQKRLAVGPYVLVLAFAVVASAPINRARADETPPVATPQFAIPPFGLGPDGFYLGTIESGFQLRLRGVIQVDGRDYPHDSGLASSDGFLIRRARPIIEGTVAQIVDFRILPDFAGSAVQLFDAYVDLHPTSWIGLRVGKAKSPFGLERLQAEQSLTFVERALPSDLAPDRDIGADLHGDVFGVFSYDFGVFNGAPDGNSDDSDTGGKKDIDGRIFIHPFVPFHLKQLENISIGFAFTQGGQQGNVTTTSLAPYKSAGQITFFSYLVDSKNIATVIANGDRFRYMPQLNAYVGPFGVYAEYVGETVNVSKVASAAQLTNDAWDVAATAVLTGEAASYNGIIPLSAVGAGGIGAIELAARFEGLDIDPATFPLFADPTKSARRARAVGGEVNWYLNRNTKLAFLFERTLFEGGAAVGNRPSENDAIGRVQVFF